MNRGRPLVALQESLVRAASDQSSASPARAYLPFEAAGRTWALSAEEVNRLAMPTNDITSLQGCADTHACILGVMPTDAEMLSVVDAGLLLGGSSVVRSLKTRLIVFAEGALKGVAIMVDRIHDRVDSVDAESGVLVLSAADLYSKLSHLAGAAEA
ncbi:chemotaxis signal transduction protein [Roseateles asaccharophilus]|uniref:chemotaxis protein CheW n=1 Tax=Roseateles asaccharophilus TaxID=582607 RepID=UPI003837AA6B